MFQKVRIYIFNFIIEFDPSNVADAADLEGIFSYGDEGDRDECLEMCTRDLKLVQKYSPQPEDYWFRGFDVQTISLYSYTGIIKRTIIPKKKPGTILYC